VDDERRSSMTARDIKDLIAEKEAELERLEQESTRILHIDDLKRIQAEEAAVLQELSDLKAKLQMPETEEE
jgi:hypothetical protein